LSDTTAPSPGPSRGPEAFGMMTRGRPRPSSPRGVPFLSRVLSVLEVARYGVTRSPFVVQSAKPTATIGYSRRAPRCAARTTQPSSREVAVSFRVLPEGPAVDLSVGRTSRGVLSPSAHPAGEIHYPWPSQRQATFPPTGFLTLLAASSFPCLPGLFHPGNARGVSPFRGFPSRGATTPRR